jgi:cell division protein FtsN
VPSPVANEQQNNNQQPQNTEQQSKPTEQPQQQTTQQQSTQPQQTQTQQQTSQPPQQQTQTQQNPEPKLDGVTKNSMGWMDDKLKVIYVKLDNGKYTIQESAWDSDAKASKRISTVSAYNIGGLSGTVFKVDLGDKGTWFRARFGEFASLEEAKAKAEELRNKERMKFQAALLLFLLYA